MMLNGGVYDSTRVIADTTIALHQARGRHARTRLGYLRRLGKLREVSPRRRVRSHRLYGHVAVDRSRSRHVRGAAHQSRARRESQASGESDRRRSRRPRRCRCARGHRLRGRHDGHARTFRADKAVDWNRPVRRPRKHTSRRELRASTHSSAHTPTKPKASSSTASRRR